MLIEKIMRRVKHPVKYMCIFYAHHIPESIKRITPDKLYLKIQYFNLFGKKLNLRDPQNFNEKLQWLKLYNRQPQYTDMVDKTKVKQIVSKIIGEEHIIPTLGVYDRFDDIPFDELPENFVLKCTHDSGSICVCKDRESFDIEEARKKINSFLRENYFYSCREWPYKNVKPRIIVEPFYDSLGKPNSIEYKITCFNGHLGFSTICKGIAHDTYEARTNDHYDKDFNILPFYVYYKNSDNPIKEKPPELSLMEEYAEKISSGIPYLRVDFYCIDGQVYFGETTFYTWSGLCDFQPPEWNDKLGKMIELPKKRR